MEPRFSIDGQINYTKYKQLAEENIDFWSLVFKLGYDTVNRMDVDEFLEAIEALDIINKGKNS